MIKGRKNILTLLLTLLFGGLTAFGQDSTRITGDFSGIKFNKFIELLESKISYHFYYDPSPLDTVTINVQADNTSLNDLLARAFKTRNIFYSINEAEKTVFVSTKPIATQEALPPDFFDRRKSSDSSGYLLADGTGDVDNKQKIQGGIENKLFEIGTKTAVVAAGNTTLAGYVREAKNGEAVSGATVSLAGSGGVVSDKFGFYSITVPRGRYVLNISSIGMKPTKRELMIYGEGKLNIELQDDVPTLKTVVVIAEKNSNVRRMQMGVEQLSIKAIKKVPVLLGEPDILRVILTLPGVTSVGEASTGFNVRGGSADQNLILLNNATIYNPSHLFGFFSSFNPDVVKNVELYKSSIPEKYGGRVSSVLEVTTKDGNTKKWTGSGGIGLLTSKLNIEGPLIKDKTSVVIGGRTSYSDWLLTKIPDSDYKNSSASFYDVDFHLNHTFDSKNNLYIGGYLSNDKFRLSNDTTYSYGNKNVMGRFKHVFSNRLYATLDGGLDYYEYAVKGDAGSINAYKLNFNIKQLHFRADFIYSPSNKHTLNFGINTIRYGLNPGSYQPDESGSLVVPKVVPAEQGLESAIYLGDKFDITSRLSANAGIRYSMFNYLGPHDVYSYIPGLPRDESTMVDTTSYAKGKVINTYHGPEFRFALRYSLSENSSIKASYNTVRQYIHLLSNTQAISPTDIWKLSDPNIKPQFGEQLSLGFYKNFRSNTLETSVEVYYKNLKNYLDYKSGATLILNNHIETDVINTKGRAYGIEFLIRKSTGKLNGWLSYTYSRTELKMDDTLTAQQINKGSYYPANYDKPHNVNLVGNYRFTHRYSVSLNTVYTTGRPITLPIAIYDLAGAQRLFYSERNQYRIADYFRIDLAVNIDGNHRVKQLIHTSWSLGVYNLTARKNPYSVYFVQENGVIKGYELSIIGTIVPYITFNFRF